MSENALRVSVAIPTRDEEETIGSLIEALVSQTHPPDEIIVVDGGSRDRTVDIVNGYADRGARVETIGPAFPGRGRNAAIRASRNEWVALIDAGCIPLPSWLAELLAPLALDPHLEAVFGDYRPALETEWDKAQALALVGAREPSTGLHPPAAVSALIRRACFDRVGGFREDLRAAEDLVFFRALDEGAVRSTRAPRAVVTWRLAPGPLAAFRRLRLYSEHHIRSGLAHTWHWRVMAMDVAGVGLLAAAPFFPAVLVLLLGAVTARVVLTAYRRRTNLSDPLFLTLPLLLRVALLLFLADAAAWLGALAAAARRVRSS